MREHDKRIFCGLFDGQLEPLLRRAADGVPQDFLYFDNPYFRRDIKHIRFRLIKGAAHLTHLLPKQPGRVIDVPELQPWRPAGRRQHILVIPPSPTQLAFYRCDAWLAETLHAIKDASKRPVVVKHDKYAPLELGQTFCMVTFASVAGVEAAVAGVPVFSGPYCPTRAINAGPLGRIEHPALRDRRPWLRSLGYACWDVAELQYLDLDNYNYAISDDCS